MDDWDGDDSEDTRTSPPGRAGGRGRAHPRRRRGRGRGAVRPAEGRSEPLRFPPRSLRPERRAAPRPASRSRRRPGRGAAPDRRHARGARRRCRTGPSRRRAKCRSVLSGPTALDDDDGDEDDLNAWSALSGGPPRWRDQHDAWDDAGFDDASVLADDEPPLGALDERRPARRSTSTTTRTTTSTYDDFGVAATRSAPIPLDASPVGGAGARRRARAPRPPDRRASPRSPRHRARVADRRATCRPAVGLGVGLGVVALLAFKLGPAWTMLLATAVVVLWPRSSSTTCCAAPATNRRRCRPRRHARHHDRRLPEGRDRATAGHRARRHVHVPLVPRSRWSRAARRSTPPPRSWRSCGRASSAVSPSCSARRRPGDSPRRRRVPARRRHRDRGQRHRRVSSSAAAWARGRSRRRSARTRPSKASSAARSSRIVVTVVHPEFIPGVAPWDGGKAFWLALVVSIVAPLGDLAESMIKRDLGIKDMGRSAARPRRDLDRFDALLFVPAGRLLPAQVSTPRTPDRRRRPRVDGFDRDPDPRRRRPHPERSRSSRSAPDRRSTRSSSRPHRYRPR